MSLDQSRQDHIANTLLSQQFVNEFVHMNNRVTAHAPFPKFATVVQKWFQVGVNVDRFPDQAKIKRTQGSKISVVNKKKKNEIFFPLILWQQPV